MAHKRYAIKKSLGTAALAYDTVMHLLDTTQAFLDLK